LLTSKEILCQIYPLNVSLSKKNISETCSNKDVVIHELSEEDIQTLITDLNKHRWNYLNSSDHNMGMIIMFCN